MTPPRPPIPGAIPRREPTDPHPTPDNLARLPLRRKESTELPQAPLGADLSGLAGAYGALAAEFTALRVDQQKTNQTFADAIKANTEQGAKTEAAVLQLVAVTGDLRDAIGKPGDPSVFARATLRDMTPTEIEAAETGSGLWGEIGRGKIRDYQMMRLVASEAAEEAAEKAKPNARKAAAWATAIGTGIGAVVSNLPWDKWF